MSGSIYEADAQQRNALDIKRCCSKFLSHHQPISASAWLCELSSDSDLDVDFYGDGHAISQFEAEMAVRLGKPAAAFFPSGVMAQQAALRVVADKSGRRAVALHPRCHIAAEEEDAYQRLHGLNAAILTDEPRQPTAADFEALGASVGSLVIELPLRRVAYALPCWHELQTLSSAARHAGVWVHLDGARLWECTPYYQRSASQIAELADSVYVSLYKGLGGIAGAVLAGPQAFIGEARVWRRRHGGLLKSVFPLIGAARRGLTEHLPKMGAYVETAGRLASAMNQIDGLRTAPSTPRVNAFQVHFPASAARMQAAHLAFAAVHHVWLFDGFRESDRADCSQADITLGDAIERWTVNQAVDDVRHLMESLDAPAKPTPNLDRLSKAQLALAMRGHSEAVADCGVKAFPW
jgi:threonine aldolase